MTAISVIYTANIDSTKWMYFVEIIVKNIELLYVENVSKKIIDFKPGFFPCEKKESKINYYIEFFSKSRKR